ncbi:MAG: DUF1015 domain-containing protein [Eubacteriales bacterium]|nr:DUF1015 domain-containing protein [Eubacteriales bacterium]
MADVRPFRCIHPAAGLESRVSALPYDVYSREEAAKAVAGKPLSFLNVDRPETMFGPEQDMYAPEVYEAAADRLREMGRDGVFVQEEEPVYYLYELTMEGRSQTGIVACASIDDYASQVIKKHENTRAEKEEDRIRHVDACSAQTGPIFLAYRAREGLARIIRQVKTAAPDFSFTAEDQVRHAGWRIADPETVDRIRREFSLVDSVYIADGHHRAASAVKVGFLRRRAHPDYDGTEEFNYFLSVFFPDDELLIMDYNRVVRDLNGLSEEAFLRKTEEKFEVRRLEGREAPRKKGQISMYLHGRWYGLTVRPEYESTDPVQGLDVSYLHRELLAPALGIGDERTDGRIDFVGGIRGLAELERRADSDCEAAFAMYPTAIGELFAVADRGLLMPPKSTWFEPKLRSGLFLHRIEEA